MSSSFVRLFRRSAAAGVAVAALLPALAMAQEAAPDEANSNSDSDIVVTGTLVRGAVPTGTNVIGITPGEVQATGATTTAQLLQSIPQLGTFNNLQYPAQSGNTVTVNRPSLRNLPGITTAGGSTTLVLMDGHRIVGAGVTSTTPDPDVIPPGAIERVEIVPDGGSAVYGSDAVAGVINFITRRKFDGLKVDGHYGFADDYYQFDASLTVGKDWGTGGIYLSYNYAKHDSILGNERDYVRQYPDVGGVTNGLTTIACTPGNVVPNPVPTPAVIYGLPYGLGAGVAVPNQCDNSDRAAVYPAESRHSVFAGLSQDLSAHLKIDIRAFYTNRKMSRPGDMYRPATGSTVQSTNVGLAAEFLARRIGAETAQTIYYAFGPQDATAQRLSLSTWGVTPTITADLGTNWQLRVMGNYGESTTENHGGTFGSTALSNAVAAGLFNPYNPAASNPAALAAISNYETFGLAKQRLVNFRAIIDGDLVNLPGGAVKLAAGAEYVNESWQSLAGDIVKGSQYTGFAGLSVGPTLVAPPAAPLRVNNLGRKVKSVFGELIVPIFGADNATGGLQELTLSASGRYDDYSDVGSTFNPKFGLTYRPVDWFKIRGSWGKSFNAPSLADSASADITTIFITSFFPSGSLLASQGGPYPDVSANQVAYVRRGNSPGIQPQTAKTLSLGFDMQPPFVPGLDLGFTYFRINLKGVIGLPPGQNPVLVYRDYAQVVTVNPSDAFLDGIVAGAQSFPFGGACHNAPANCNVYAFVDISKNNLGNFNLEGLDMSARYTTDTGFGSIYFSANANLELKREQSASATTPFLDQLSFNASKFKIRTTIGAKVGNFQGDVTWNYNSGYNLNPAVGFIPQSRIASYSVFDLFFRYNLPGEGLSKDLSLTLNVNNVFDADPPLTRQPITNTPAASGYINGATLGRLIQFGVSKHF
jgi:iron complex outermembrane receptor protein